MKFAEESLQGKHTIRAYEKGRLAINEQVVDRSVILSAEVLITDWEPQCFEDFKTDHFSQIREMEPEVLIIGTGETLRFPPFELTAALAEAGVGVEVMDTAAACRTYNILVGEERRVVAALLMI